MAVQITESAKRKPNDERRASAALTVDLRKTTSGNGGAPFSLDVSFTALAGVTVLFGASGSGKTTVLDCIAGLKRPDAGRIATGNRVFFDSGAGVNLAVAHRRTGYVFQDLALFPHLSVAANVTYGIERVPSGERRGRVDAILQSFRILHLRDRRPRELSGGERQRVALARALVTNPAVLLLDEPLSGLDLPTKSRIMDDIQAWNDEHCVPILYVTHDRAEVFALAERVVVLEQGSALAVGNPLEVLNSPKHELTAQLVGIDNIFEGIVENLHEDRGTMTCMVGPVELEVPLVRVDVGSHVRIGIRAGDVLIANVRPVGLSARNIIPGRIVSLARRDMTVVARVDCGTVFEVHLTPHAQQTLGLESGREVWLVLKTHSCHLLRS